MTPRFHTALPLPHGPMSQNGDLSRLSADIPARDKNLIKGVCPKRGILNQLTQNLFLAITNNLRKNGITYYSPDHEQYFIALILRGCSAIELAEPTTGRDVDGGASLTCARAERSLIILAHASQEGQPRQSGSETQKGVENTGCKKDAE